ncbi:MAG: type II secretion system protein GspM [Gammaproteobacteria bacterium]
MTKLQHALLSVTVLLLVLLIINFGIIQPSIAKRETNDARISDLQFRLEKFMDSKQLIRELKSEIAKSKAEQSDINDFFEDKPAALVAADLQQQIKKLVESNGGSLISTHAMGEEEEEIFNSVIVKVHMRGNIGSLQKIFYKLSNAKPVLFIDNLMIQKQHRTTSRRGRKEIFQNAPGQSNLEIRFDMSGYIYSSGAS